MWLLIYINMWGRNEIDVVCERDCDGCVKVMIVFVVIEVGKVGGFCEFRNGR